MKKLAFPLVLFVATLCWAAGHIHFDLTQRVADQSSWNISGQEYVLALDSAAAFAKMEIPGIDSVRLLSVRCITLDTSGNPYCFRIGVNGAHWGMNTDTFLGINLSDSAGATIVTDSVYIGNPITTNPDIEVSVFVAGEK